MKSLFIIALIISFLKVTFATNRLRTSPSQHSLTKPSGSQKAKRISWDNFPKGIQESGLFQKHFGNTKYDSFKTYGDQSQLLKFGNKGTEKFILRDGSGNIDKIFLRTDSKKIGGNYDLTHLKNNPNYNRNDKSLYVGLSATENRPTLVRITNENGDYIINNVPNTIGSKVRSGSSFSSTEMASLALNQKQNKAAASNSPSPNNNPNTNAAIDGQYSWRTTPPVPIA